MNASNWPVAGPRLLAGTAVVVSLGGCPPEPTVTSPTAEAPTIDNIDDHPARFVGERVALAGEVEEVLDERTFVLENDDLLWDDEVTVVSRQPIRYGVERLGEDEYVAISGVVHYVGTVELERELGWDFETELEVEMEGEPVVVADEVGRMERTARWSESEAPPPKSTPPRPRNRSANGSAFETSWSTRSSRTARSG